MCNLKVFLNFKLNAHLCTFFLLTGREVRFENEMKLAGTAYRANLSLSFRECISISGIPELKSKCRYQDRTLHFLSWNFFKI